MSYLDEETEELKRSTKKFLRIMQVLISSLCVFIMVLYVFQSKKTFVYIVLKKTQRIAQICLKWLCLLYLLHITW